MSDQETVIAMSTHPHRIRPWDAAIGDRIWSTGSVALGARCIRGIDR